MQRDVERARRKVQRRFGRARHRMNDVERLHALVEVRRRQPGLVIVDEVGRGTDEVRHGPARLLVGVVIDVRRRRRDGEVGGMAVVLRRRVVPVVVDGDVLVDGQIVEDA